MAKLTQTAKAKCTILNSIMNKIYQINDDTTYLNSPGKIVWKLFFNSNNYRNLNLKRHRFDFTIITFISLPRNSMYSYILSPGGICWPSFLQPSVPNQRTVTTKWPVNAIRIDQKKEKEQRKIFGVKRTYSLRPKKKIILGILGQINKKVKWPCMPLFITHMALIDSCMHMHF